MDFVLTFEELAGIIEGKDLDIDLLEVDENEAALCSASAAGRGFAQSGGVANAVASKIKEWHPPIWRSRSHPHRVWPTARSC